MLGEARKNLRQAVSSESENLSEFARREAYLEEFERVCNRFDVEVELDEKSDEEIYQEWQEATNVTASELQKWSRNPCSRQASRKPVTVIKRNLRLLERNKDEWTENDYEDAQRTISFINRMNSEEMRPDSPRKGPHGCPSEWAISLLNWAFNPFDSIPSPSSEVKDDLDAVEQIELQERDNIRKADELAEPVWQMKDVLAEFSREFEDYAMDLEETKDDEKVEQIRQELVEKIDVLMEQLQPPVRKVKEMQEDQVFEFEPVPDQVLYVERDDAEERAEDLGLDGVHTHPVLFGMDMDELPEEVRENLTVHYMAGSQHSDWTRKVKGGEEMSSTRKASRVVHADQEKHLNASEKDEAVRVPPVAIHRVESGATEVSEDVSEVLDSLWEKEDE